MKVAFGTDHAAGELRDKIIEHLKANGHEVEDFGCASAESCDYPDFASRVGRAVSEGRAERGVLICGTGIGMSIVANKFKGVRAAVVHDEFTVEVSRSHNDSNVLCMGPRVLPAETIMKLMDMWFATQAEGGRHARRVEKIKKIEEDNFK